jgi:hypothetical protein
VTGVGVLLFFRLIAKTLCRLCEGFFVAFHYDSPGTKTAGKNFHSVFVKIRFSNKRYWKYQEADNKIIASNSIA